MFSTGGTVIDIKERLAALSLDTRGNKETLKKRLKKAKLASEQPLTSITKANNNVIDSKTSNHLKYILCLDFEATCDENTQWTYENEIIEFPAILLHTSTMSIVDEFHSYVKPSKHPILSDFCKNLTGITQTQVNSSPCFSKVLLLFNEFINKHNLFTPENPTIFATDGPWDLRDFISKQSLIDNFERPNIFNLPFLDIRSAFTYYFHTKSTNLDGMLAYFNLTFEGRPHSGIDDARNVSRIICEMMRSKMLNNKPIKIKVNRWIKKDGSDWIIRNGKWIKNPAYFQR